ncbi:MAG: T9SS type A sorting domain-containing protein [Bacteroidia bacterium]
MHYNKLLPTLFLALINSLVFAQGVGIGQWRDHLPYTNAKTLTEAGDRIYCASEEGLFYYSKSETTVDKLSKINGMSDIGYSTINYDSLTNTLVVAYTNANIDLIQDTRIINIPDIKRKIIPGNKIINKIFFKDTYAYLACGFGIVVVDLIKKEIKDTYYIGPDGSSINVTDVTCDGNEFYASSDAGIFHAPVNAPNLANYNFWTKYNNLPPTNSNTGIIYNTVEYHAGNVFASMSVPSVKDTLYVFDGNTWNYFDTITFNEVRSITSRHNKLAACGYGFMMIYNENDSLIQNIYQYFGMANQSPNPMEGFSALNGDYWIADNGQGLVKNSNVFDYSNVHPNGPRFATAFDMSVENSNLWVASGGVSVNWSPQFKSDGVASYINNTWNTVYPTAVTGVALTDIIRVAVDPVNPEKVYAGAWVNGMAEITNSSQSQAFDTSNSTLDDIAGYTRVGGFDFDADGNLWVANSNVPSPISVLKTNGTWKNFSPPNFNTQNRVGDLVIDSYNQKWLMMPYGAGLLVFNDNYTIDVTTDDKYKTMTTSTGSGALPSIYVYSIAEDLDGEIWVGTDKGIAVFYSPGEIFAGNGNFDSQQILIEQDGYAQYLFETEIVSAIAVDGGNRKWIGTQNAGVFLMSPDGTEELLHFTEDNSPLFSNNILSIAIDDVTGEVFIGTQKGIISYKGTATEGGEIFNDVYAYPNPVHSGYDGPIAIKGLVKDADVKITDVSGNLVYATTANGGQAVWNGKKFDGEKVATGVYLVFASNEDGSQTHITKILVVN